MTHRFTILLVLLLAQACYAGAKEYAVADIPPALLKKAHAVVRERIQQVQVDGPGEMTVKGTTVVTVLDDKGGSFGSFLQSYNQMWAVVSLKGRILDRNGGLLRKLKNSDFQDVGYSDGDAYSDTRYKSFSAFGIAYPYTCVYEYELAYTTTMIIPPWLPDMFQNCAVEHSGMELSFPVGMVVNYKTYNFTGTPVATVVDGRNVVKVSCADIPAHGEPDEFAPQAGYPGPAMVITAGRIAMGPQQGSMASWQDFGRFVYDLNAHRDSLPDNIKLEVHRLTDTCTTTFSKIDILYRYMQQHTRYVNIMLGLDGFRTHDAVYVAEKGYGDCKALSNYMKALLAEAHITAWQVLVWGGEQMQRTIDPAFTSSVFNHVILCVPQAQDTVWLECTSSTHPAGFLSSFTSGRSALLLAPSGGYIVNTPPVTAAVNTVSRKAIVSVTSAGDMKGSIDGMYTGDRAIAESGMTSGSDTRLENYFNRKFAMSTYSVSNCAVKKHSSGRSPVLHEHMSFTGSGCMAGSGSQVYINPRVFHSALTEPSVPAARQDSFQLLGAVAITDTVDITVDGYTPDGLLPLPVTYTYPFATYSMQAMLSAGHLIMVTTLRQNRGVYAPALFADYVKLCREVSYNATGTRVLFRKM